MPNGSLLQFTLELYGAFFSMVCFIYVLAEQKKGSGRSILLMRFLLLNTVLLLSDAAAIRFRGYAGNLGWYTVRISNFLVFVLYYLIGIVALNYLEQFLEERSIKILPAFKYLIYGLCGGAGFLVILTQFTGFIYYFDENNIYHRGSGFGLISILAAMMLIFLLGMTLFYIKYLKPLEYAPLLALFILPLAAHAVQIVHYGISLVNIAMMLGSILMFLCYEIERSRTLAEQNRIIYENELAIAEQKMELLQRQMELSEKKNQIMLSQIQPHFLYNTLGTIEYLCDIDVRQAKNAIHHFAKYLRMNMSSLNNDRLIDFEKELEFTRAYLWIEKMRFQDELQINYDLQATEFQMPPLTLQPVVENAVRHGICGVPGGGTITIFSHEEEEEIVLAISDTGAGFDQKKMINDGHRHVGLENVRARMEMLCAGTLTIQSYPEKGTRVIFRIPRKRGEEQ